MHDFEKDIERSRRQKRRAKAKSPKPKLDLEERQSKVQIDRNYEDSEPDIIFGKVIHVSEDSILTLQITRQEYSNRYLYQPVEKVKLPHQESLEKLLSQHIVCEVHGRNRTNVLLVTCEQRN